MQTHSELMSIYPWGETNRPRTSRTFNLPDTVASRAARSCSASRAGRRRTPKRTTGPPPSAAPARRRARAPARPSAGRRATSSAPPPAPTRRAARRAATTPRTARARAASSPTTSSSRARAAPPCGSASAGSETGARGARRELRRHARRPGAALRAQDRASARRSRAHTQLDLPGDRLLAARHRVEQAEPRRLGAGGARPRAARGQRGHELPTGQGTMAKARFVGAGFPDYPWLFATDGEYTAFASVALGQFEPIKEHLRALRDVNQGLNDASRQGRPRGGHRRLGVLRRQRRRGQHRRDSQVPERGGADLALDGRRRLP